MTTTDDLRPPGGMREVIADSWRRADLNGLDPCEVLGNLETVRVDPSSTLLMGAAPVLAELEDSLRGSSYATFLVDRDCRVVRRWCDDPTLEAGFDALNITHGTSLLEENIGTNALGTVLETRRGVSVHGAEHFAEALKRFSCYGHPIRHPLTKRIEGVLDITAALDEASPLLPPLVARAVRDIEQRLLDGSRHSEKNLLAAFQAAAGLRRRAILAIGEDIVLSNQAATDLLSPADLAMLRVLADEPVPLGGSATLELSLEGGRAVSIEVTVVQGARRGALLKVDPVTGDRARSVVHRSATERTVGAPALVAGVPGTGRTTRARELATRKPVNVLRPATALLDGGHAWARDFERAMARPGGSVCIDGIDLLPDALLDLVIESVDRPDRPHLVLTSGPVDQLAGRAATLAGMATERDELVPLSARRSDIPELAASMLRECAGPSVHLSPSVVQALTAQSWPGNLRELHAVMAHVAAHRAAGAVTLDDLPEQYRSRQVAGPRSALELAERDVIVTALKRADGNKVRAAQDLGLSRTTLYARMRALRITTY